MTTPRPYPPELQKFHEGFTDKSRGGHPIRIYDYIDGQRYPIMGGVQHGANKEWTPISWGVSGRHFGSGNEHEFDLIPVKQVLPKDILCEVWGSDLDSTKVCRYSSGEGSFYYGGADSFLKTGELLQNWPHYKVVENPIRPWFGGECPIPEGCRFRVFIDGKWFTDVSKDDYEWGWITVDNHNITAYQILGEL